MEFRNRLRNDDVPRIANLLRQVGVFTDAEITCGMEIARQTLEGEEGYYWILAEEVGELLGLICYGPVPLTEGTWDMYWIVRSPSAAGRGVAGRLLQACEVDVRKQGGRLLVLNTSGTANYQPARGFYLRHGFHLQAQIPEYYRPGDDLIIYVKNLPSGS